MAAAAAGRASTPLGLKQEHAEELVSLKELERVDREPRLMTLCHLRVRPTLLFERRLRDER